MADDPAAPVPPEGAPAPEAATDHPVAERLRRAIQAHPILRDQKKLVVRVMHGQVRAEGQVFTQDMLRQVHDLVRRVPGGEQVRVAVEAEIKPPKDRATIGRIPDVSPGPSNVDRQYSTRKIPRRYV